LIFSCITTPQKIGRWAAGKPRNLPSPSFILQAQVLFGAKKICARECALFKRLPWVISKRFRRFHFKLYGCNVIAYVFNAKKYIKKYEIFPFLEWMFPSFCKYFTLMFKRKRSVSWCKVM